VEKCQNVKDLYLWFLFTLVFLGFFLSFPARIATVITWLRNFFRLFLLFLTRSTKKIWQGFWPALYTQNGKCLSTENIYSIIPLNSGRRAWPCCRYTHDTYLLSFFPSIVIVFFTELAAFSLWSKCTVSWSGAEFFELVTLLPTYEKKILKTWNYFRSLVIFECIKQNKPAVWDGPAGGESLFDLRLER